MLISPNTDIVIGPPGTGKTGYLIREATKVIQGGCPPEYVGYISFTRQAVREASRRIIEVTGMPQEQFSGFRTLHSMVYWILGLDHHNIISSGEMYDLNSDGDKVTRGCVAREQAELFSHLYNYHRVTGEPLADVWRRLHTVYGGTEEEFLEWVITYKQYKAATKRIDFTDMIEEFVRRKLRFPFTHLFIDEAQDFTLDQWAGVKLLAANAQHVTVAGDADQSIFAWAGADGCVFDSIEGKKTVLSQSWRVPRLPHLLASRVLERLEREVLYEPTPEKGSVSWIFPDEVPSLPFKNGETWYILCRNTCYMKQVQKVLYENNIFHQPLSMSSKDKVQDKMLRRIHWYETALNGHDMTDYQKKRLKTVVPRLEQALAENWPWYRAFENWPISRMRYYRANRDQWFDPKVRLGTFHSSKGAEADNVILMGECTKAVSESYNRESPDEYRVLYVAITRAKKNLYIVESTEKEGIPWNRLIRLPRDLTSGLL